MAREMTPHARWNWPLRRFEHEMEDLMERFMGPEALWWKGNESRFLPSVDVAETEKTFEVTVDLPGMKANDFDVELKNGNLWITGEKKEEKEEKGRTFHRVERSWGRFERVIPIPEAVDKEKVQAEYKEGVLRVTLEKSERAQPKHIEVKT